MTLLSVGQRVIVHLENYTQNKIDYYNMPWEITQDGIASALRITRAHASIELKKLKVAGKCEERQVHVKGVKMIRKVYQLTPLGREEFNKIKNIAAENNIDLEKLMIHESERCDMFYEKLSPTDKYAVGCACVFRIPVPISIIPKSERPLIPMDSLKKIIISKKFRNNIVNNSTPEEIASWHSYAADYWLDDREKISDEIDAMHERLFHLVEAGRKRDACKLISNDMYDLMMTANDDLHDTLSKIDEIPDAYKEDVYSVIIDVDIQSGDWEGAEKNIEKYSKINYNMSEFLKSDLELAKGNIDKAYDILHRLESSDPMAGIRVANILAFKGDYKRAREYLSSVETGRISNPNLAVERFLLLAKIDTYEGRDNDAYAHLMKARASVSDKGKKRIDKMIENLNFKK